MVHLRCDFFFLPHHVEGMVLENWVKIFRSEIESFGAHLKGSKGSLVTNSLSFPFSPSGPLYRRVASDQICEITVSLRLVNIPEIHLQGGLVLCPMQLL